MTKPKKAPTAGSWKPGQSGNPGGRPRTAYAFSEKVRERIDPDQVIALALEFANDAAQPVERRLAVLWQLVDRGFVKPPTTVNANVSSGPLARDYDAMPLADRERLLEMLDAAPSTGDRPAHHADKTPKPHATDDDCSETTPLQQGEPRP